MNFNLKNHFVEDFSLTRALILGCLLGITTFWNGSMVLASLMLLGGIFLFSRKKIELIIIAILSLLFSMVLTKFFVGSNASIHPGIWLGMLSTTKSLKGITSYYLLLFGIMPFLYFASLVFTKGRLKILLLIFIIPFLFANIVKLTPDVNANHKFILVFQIASSLGCALILTSLFKFKKSLLTFLGIILIFILTCTGLFDYITFYNLNNRTSVFYEQDPMKLWVMKNSSPNAVFLTPMVAIHPILLAGRNIFFGWPYFAWSAGYEVAPRMEKFQKIYSAKNLEDLKKELKNTSIDFILHEPRFMDDLDWHNAIYLQILPKVYTELDSRVLYQVPKEWSH